MDPQTIKNTDQSDQKNFERNDEARYIVIETQEQPYKHFEQIQIHSFSSC